MPPNAGGFKLNLGWPEVSPIAGIIDRITSESAISRFSVRTKTKEKANTSERILHRYPDNYLI
jgi:hypothetical protein